MPSILLLSTVEGREGRRRKGEKGREGEKRRRGEGGMIERGRKRWRVMLPK